MSEHGWEPAGWADDEPRREPLPRIEDLPIADSGYDRDAVREAFDRFYRHAGELDSTLRLLESVEAFGRQARELRSDIRSLRAASWGPAPSARHVWSVGHETWSTEAPTAVELTNALPRLAIWAALIILVGVGAALAELGTALIVALVLGAWLVVGVLEVAIAGRSASRRAAPYGPVAVEPRVAAVEPAGRVPDVPGQETIIEPPPADAVDDGAEVAEPPRRRSLWPRRAPESEPAESDAEPGVPAGPPSHVRILPVEPAEPEPVAAEQADAERPDEPVEAPVAVSADVAAANPAPDEVPEPAGVAAEHAPSGPDGPGVVADAPERGAVSEPPPEPPPEPEPAAEAAPPRRRFWHRRTEPELPVSEAADPWTSERPAADPWEQGLEPPDEDTDPGAPATGPAPEPVAEAAPEPAAPSEETRRRVSLPLRRGRR